MNQESGCRDNAGIKKDHIAEKISGPLSLAIQYALVALLAFLGAYYIVAALPGASGLTYVGALWALISGIVVMQETRELTLNTASLRIFGSFIGAATSAVYLSFLPFSPLGMAAMIGLTVLICVALNLPGHARLAALTVGVIMVFSTINPDLSPVINAGLRFFEVIIGSIVAICIIWIWPFVTRPFSSI